MSVIIYLLMVVSSTSENMMSARKIIFPSEKNTIVFSFIVGYWPPSEPPKQVEAVHTINLPAELTTAGLRQGKRTWASGGTILPVTGDNQEPESRPKPEQIPNPSFTKRPTKPTLQWHCQSPTKAMTISRLYRYVFRADWDKGTNDKDIRVVLVATAAVDSVTNDNSAERRAAVAPACCPSPSLADSRQSPNAVEKPQFQVAATAALTLERRFDVASVLTPLKPRNVMDAWRPHIVASLLMKFRMSNVARCPYRVPRMSV
ncbi:hypothetical protein FISHEDRAFT_55180 [Fistulina hepatica ATCC 64428]|uniref:Uncharacterized protein n=1 Tax=Fistulina hepatica ATCC 64428 TaxID=1128425 RepID=A0A0D7ANW0_9AGAR|nr:hypothetical protein FISHEDRAFT_55180 [Fistulina hepatica ATCC 64428]